MYRRHTGLKKFWPIVANLAVNFSLLTSMFSMTNSLPRQPGTFSRTRACWNVFICVGKQVIVFFCTLSLDLIPFCWRGWDGVGWPGWWRDWNQNWRAGGKPGGNQRGWQTCCRKLVSSLATSSLLGHLDNFLDRSELLRNLFVMMMVTKMMMTIMMGTMTMTSIIMTTMTMTGMFRPCASCCRRRLEDCKSCFSFSAIRVSRACTWQHNWKWQHQQCESTQEDK